MAEEPMRADGRDREGAAVVHDDHCSHLAQGRERRTGIVIAHRHDDRDVPGPEPPARRPRMGGARVEQTVEQSSRARGDVLAPFDGVQHPLAARTQPEDGER
jgi:hypothetical protein